MRTLRDLLSGTYFRYVGNTINYIQTNLFVDFNLLEAFSIFREYGGGREYFGQVFSDMTAKSEIVSLIPI